MLPWWGSLISLGLKMFGLVDAALAWEARWEAKRDGAIEQQGKDNAATVQEGKDAQTARDAAAINPDLAQRLRDRYTSKP